MGARRAACAVTALTLVALGLGCRITPHEIRRIETENDLLRQEIRVIRTNCEYYQQQDLELEVDDPDR